MAKIFTHPLLMAGALILANTLYGQAPAPDFTVTTSDGQVKKLYQDYTNQQKLVVIEAFFTTCPPCATHAPLFQTLYTAMQAAHPGQVEFILLSTLVTDTNVKVAQYKTSKGLTMPGVGKDGGSIAALQPYLNGQYGPFQGTPTFIVIAPGSGTVYFDIRGNTPTQTIALLQQKIEELLPKTCRLENPFGAPLEEVNIVATALAFDTSITADGTYSLSHIPALQNTPYQVKPRKTGPPSGLTTYDLVLISKHILALEFFNCPWQILAADVNCNGSVTTFDIVNARKVILGILDSFPCGNWRFMPDSAAASNGNCQDFIGVQLGDVNAGPCNDSLFASPSGNRAQPQRLCFREYEFLAGETARVPLFFMNATTLEGIQADFDLDPDVLKVNMVETGVLEGFDRESYHLGERRLAWSWVQPRGQYLGAAAPFLTLDVTAPQGGKLSELLRFSASGLSPEAYGPAGEIHPLELASLPTQTDYFISPNPAIGSFSLQANVAEEQGLLVQILDVQGKVVFEQTFAASVGLNTWVIETDGKSPGLYFLKANGEAAGKLVLWP